MLPWSNDSHWEEASQLLPNGRSPIPSSLQFCPISSTAGPTGEGTLVQHPKGVPDLAGKVEEGKESPGEDGFMLAVRA